MNVLEHTCINQKAVTNSSLIPRKPTRIAGQYFLYRGSE